MDRHFVKALLFAWDRPEFRAGLDTAEIRRATLLLVEDDDVRSNLAAGITGSIADRPELARAIRSALDDPQVRTELREALESASLRAVIWKVVENQFKGRRWALIREAVLLVVRHRHARRLVLALRRHGVIRELRRQPAATYTGGHIHRRPHTQAAT